MGLERLNPLAPLFDLISEAIPDPDKRRELEAKITQARIQVDQLIMQTTTIPWVDALVKIMYALERFIVTLWRPIGAAAMTAFGMYAHYKGIDIGEANHLILDGAFPAWGASRHMEKTKKINKQPDLPDIVYRDPTARGSKR